MRCDTCGHSIALEGRAYRCTEDPANHDPENHRARVPADRVVSVGVLERGVEIVWPRGERELRR